MTYAERSAILRSAVEVQAVTLALRVTVSQLRSDSVVLRRRSRVLRDQARVLRSHRRS